MTLLPASDAVWGTRGKRKLRRAGGAELLQVRRQLVSAVLGSRWILISALVSYRLSRMVSLVCSTLKTDGVQNYGFIL